MTSLAVARVVWLVLWSVWWVVVWPAAEFDSGREPGRGSRVTPILRWRPTVTEEPLVTVSHKPHGEELAAQNHTLRTI